MIVAARLLYTIPIILTCLSLMGTPLPASVPETPSVEHGERDPVTQARDRVFSAVVSIVTIVESHEDGKARLARSGGSGTIVSDEGHIVTNAHVVINGTKFKVILADKTECDAELIGEDPLSDIAVLKFDPKMLGDDATLTVATFGDSDEVEIGDTVLAMGAPWGMSHSMSLGVVNNDKRLLSSFFEDDADYESDLDRDQPTGSFYRWIQHDAAIAPGNSGGPLVNLKGEIIGVNTRGIPFGGNMGFASPSTVVRDVARQLIENGEVERSFIGLQFKPIQTTDHHRGVLVNSVVEDSPADRAGLQPGDLIVAINDDPVTVHYKEQMPEFRRGLSDLPVGRELKIDYRRDDQQRETRLATAQYEKDVGPRRAMKDWGITVREMTPRMARNRRLAEVGGLLVTSVALGGPAASARPGLKAEDVIRAVDGMATPDLDAYLTWQNARPATPGKILVAFEREGEQLLTILEPREEENDYRPREIDKPWLPVEVQALHASLANEAGLDGLIGYRVTRVYDEASVGSSGLAIDDVITAIGETPVRPSNPLDRSTFERALRRQQVGETAELHLVRNGEPKTLPVELLSTPPRPDEASRARIRLLDLEIRDVTFFDIARNRWKTGTSGVITTEVEPGGLAGVGHLRVDDLILEMDGQKVLDAHQFTGMIESLQQDGRDVVRLLIMRGVETRLLFLQTEWK